MRRLPGIVALLLLSILLSGCGGKEETTADSTKNVSMSGGGKKLVIAWAQWKPSDYLQTLSKAFTQQSGIPVEVKQIPWGQFQQKIQTEVWAGKSDAYDLVIGDSQWLGRGQTEGHYTDLTEWSQKNVPWNDYTENIKTFYCQYNGKIVALPCEADATGFAYRKDLFENPQEQTAFKAKYHYDLAPPKTWGQFRDVAEFFTRPDKRLYGCSLFYQGNGAGGYDGVTMGFMQVLWCQGGELFDPKTHAVDKIINSPAAIKALEFYTKTLKAFTPPGSENYYFNESLKAFTSGQVAMAMDWFTFFPALVDPSQNQFADKTGFFVSPAGSAGRYISLGGQGISISSYSKQQEAAKQFLTWFSKRETQQQWAKLGGLTCNKVVLDSPEFKQATPFNPVFAASVPYLRDFYNNPKYADLLDATQIQWNAAAAGTVTPQQAMDAVAQKHTATLKEGGLLQ